MVKRGPFYETKLKKSYNDEKTERGGPFEIFQHPFYRK